MRAWKVNEGLGKMPVYNKKEIIDFMLAGEEEEVQEIMRKEYETVSSDEFEELAAAIGFSPMGKYWTMLDMK